MTDPNLNRVLANRYQLVELVGEGSMGRVYRAKDILLGSVTVAVKFLSQMLLNKKMRQRFEREATICALLGEKSIHIVRVRDYGVDDNDIPYYVMEYLQGESLSEIIQSDPLSLSRFCNITRQICVGMKSAHEGISFNEELCPIIHRDIKPSNILVLKNPTIGELVKVLDFGIAKLIQSSSTMTHSFMGTLAYCSPEQMEGRELDSRSDIYSLGVMMYEMLTGEMPLLPETSSFGSWYKAHHYLEPEPFSLELNLPTPLQNLVMKCLAKSPDARPQRVSEISIALEDLAQRNSDITLGKILPDEDDISQKETVYYSHHDNRIPIEDSIDDYFDEICLKSSWPKNKPQRKIVFPALIPTETVSIPSLWVMLDAADLSKRKFSTRYNQFLFMNKPHPMILWITVLYKQEYGPRWLPCYLDLKTNAGEGLTRILGEKGSYRILLFSLNNLQSCEHLMYASIAPKPCKLLQEWADSGKNSQGSNNSKISKQKLKQEFEKLKPKILMKLEGVNPHSGNISG